MHRVPHRANASHASFVLPLHHHEQQFQHCKWPNDATLNPAAVALCTKHHSAALNARTQLLQNFSVKWMEPLLFCNAMHLLCCRHIGINQRQCEMDHQVCLQECNFLEIWLGKQRISIASADDVCGATLTNQSLEQSECNAWCDWSANKMQTGRHHSRSKKPLWRQDGHRVTMCKRPKGGRQRVKNPHSVQQKICVQPSSSPFFVRQCGRPYECV